MSVVESASPKAVLLIPAAGSGRRMGGSVSKQYLQLAGRPLLAHTLALFDSHPLVEAIYPIVPAEDHDYCREEIVSKYRFTKVKRLIAGGAQRQDSVRNGFLALAGDGYDQPRRPVLIHDGARPLFDPRLLPELLHQVDRQGACIVAVPVKDTIKQVAAGRIIASPERESLWQAQTPQGFQYHVLEQAFSRAGDGPLPATDDAALVAAAGFSVAVVPGDDRNLKITTPADLVIAAALLDSCREESA